MPERERCGRPPKYRSREEIEALIEQYFKDCKGRILKDRDGTPILDKAGRPVILDRHPPTVTGLALALGFTNRLSLLSYQGKAEFQTAITRAKSRVEQYAEERLFDRDGVNGARFSLANNFKGWNGSAMTGDEDRREAVRRFLKMVRPGEKELEELFRGEGENEGI